MTLEVVRTGLPEAHGAVGWTLPGTQHDIAGLPVGELASADAAEPMSIEALETQWRGGAVLSPQLLRAMFGPSLGWDVVPSVSVLPLRTPTLLPATHTNAFLIGEVQLLCVDPGGVGAAGRARLRSWIDAREAKGATLVAVALTHHHVDHVGDAGIAAERGVPLLAHAETAARIDAKVDRLLGEGDVISLGDTTVRVHHTPGHAPGHLCFVHEPSGTGIVGDMVAGIGTILIEPDGGDMGQYLASLEGLESLGLKRALPAHGGLLTDPNARFAHYRHHRLAREAKVLAALREVGPSSAHELVPIAYVDAPKAVWPLATLSVITHMKKLEEDGLATALGSGRWEAT